MWQSHPRIQLCAHHILAGGVIAYPTEAVWGLGCDPFDLDAVEAILQLKSRPVDKGLILIAGDVSQIAFLLRDIPTEQREKALASWPGPYTWLIPHHNKIPAIVHGQHATIAVRVSSHPVVKALCAAVGGPIISTSANPAGRQAAVSAAQARRYFAGSRAQQIANVVFSPGVVGASRRPSQICDLTTGKIIRAGA